MLSKNMNKNLKRMFHRMRFISLKRVIKSMILPIVLGAVISYLFLGNAITLLKRPKEILTLSESELNNAYISIGVNSVFDSFWVDRLIKGDIANFYVITTGDNQVFLPIRTNANQHRNLRPIQQQTADMFKEGKLDNTTKITLVGVLCNMTKQEKEAYNQFLVENNFKNADNQIINYVFLPGDNPFGNDKGGVYLWGGVGAGLLLVVIIQIIYGFFGGYQRKLNIMMRGFNKEQIEEMEKEFREAKNFSGDISIGVTYTFCHKGNRTELFTADEVKGIYVQKSKIQKKKEKVNLILLLN